MRAALFAILFAAVMAGPAGSQTPPSGFRLTPRLPAEIEVEAQILAGANAFRHENGLRGLTPNNVLAGEARAYAAYLARTGAFSHTADGRDPAGRAQAAGYAYCEVAENLARIEENGTRVADLTGMFMSGWERSPGHRHNLLDPQVIETGVGVARPPGRPDAYVAVQVFGRPLAERYAFRVANRSDRTIAYDVDGRQERLEPSTTVTYTVCDPTVVTFGGGLGSFHARAGALYVLRPDANGRISVAVAGDERAPD